VTNSPTRRNGLQARSPRPFPETQRQATLSTIEIGPSARLSLGDDGPWAFGTNPRAAAASADPEITSNSRRTSSSVRPDLVFSTAIRRPRTIRGRGCFVLIFVF
jgi:hypothetical protein